MKIDKISDRASKAEKLKGGNLKVVLANNTFEYELMIASPINASILHSVYSRMHPKTIFVDESEPIEIKALDLLEKLKSNKDKSEFAQQLSLEFETNLILKKAFIVPDYIQNSISWVIDRK